MHNVRVAITGATGFVGRNLLTYLCQFKEYKVISLNLRSSNFESLIHDNTVLIHLAGKAHDLKNTANPDEYFEINRDLTKKLFDLFLTSNVRDFIYFSSVKSVADTVEDILTEDIIANPRTYYGKSKYEAEQYLLSKKLPAGKRLFIMRPCMIHGPGNKGNLNLLYHFVNKKLPYPLAGFDNRRSFLSIENLNYILSVIMSDFSIRGGVYNIADDLPLSTNEVISIIAEAGGYLPKLWKINTSFIRRVARIGDKLHLPLTTERLKKLTESYVVSNDRIKKELKISKLPVSSRDGLLRTIQSFY